MAGPEHVVRLTFPAKADYLLLARLALSGLARQLPLDEELLADLKLAVTEACGNAVRHAYEEGPGPVGVAFVLGEDSLEIIVEDQGRGIPAPLGAPEPTRGPVDSGMGMAIMRAIVDELSVEPGAGGRGTVVRMRKRLPSLDAA
ncbi:MAG TPA: anti-sigma regulatory factor [Gaiellaceae bacterium]|nr:anti-sigma regulatory factor [Gaiellaceae bacterium]